MRAVTINFVETPISRFFIEDSLSLKTPLSPALDKKMREKYGIVTHDDCVSDMTKWETVPVATHTAAAWDDSDNKNARFIDGHKLTVKMSVDASKSVNVNVFVTQCDLSLPPPSFPLPLLYLLIYLLQWNS